MRFFENIQEDAFCLAPTVSTIPHELAAAQRDAQLDSEAMPEAIRMMHDGAPRKQCGRNAVGNDGYDRADLDPPPPNFSRLVLGEADTDFNNHRPILQRLPRSIEDTHQSADLRSYHSENYRTFSLKRAADAEKRKENKGKKVDI